MGDDDLTRSGSIGRSFKPLSQRLSNRLSIGSLLSPRRSQSKSTFPNRISWDSSENGVTIKQEIEASAQKPTSALSPLLPFTRYGRSSFSLRRPSSTTTPAHQHPPHHPNRHSGAFSFASEDSNGSAAATPPVIDQPFLDGRRLKLCAACSQPFGADEPVEICVGCCFERPFGCRACNWTGWGQCAACSGVGSGDELAEGGRGWRFATGFERVPWRNQKQ